MTLKDLLEQLDDEVEAVVSSNFEIEVVETDFVPTFDDSNITFDNLDDETKKCKLIETCVLYVDMRDSTAISAAKRGPTLARIYSAFVRSMISAAEHYDGYVRNIIGDRVMVVFDRDNCFRNAANAAVLMNTVAKFILAKRIKAVTFRCGIGIDFGKMLIVKAGAIRRGAESEFYRSLIWLGNPANIASKLTDAASKTETWWTPAVSEGIHYPLTNQWTWNDVSYETFIDHLKPTFSRTLMHENDYFSTFFKTTTGPYSRSYSPILMTDSVYEGLRREAPSESSVVKKLWHRQPAVPAYTGAIWGGNVHFTAGEEL